MDIGDNSLIRKRKSSVKQCLHMMHALSVKSSHRLNQRCQRQSTVIVMLICPSCESLDNLNSTTSTSTIAARVITAHPQKLLISTPLADHCPACPLSARLEKH